MNTVQLKDLIQALEALNATRDSNEVPLDIRLKAAKAIGCLGWTVDKIAKAVEVEVTE